MKNWWWGLLLLSASCRHAAALVFGSSQIPPPVFSGPAKDYDNTDYTAYSRSDYYNTDNTDYRKDARKDYNTDNTDYFSRTRERNGQVGEYQDARKDYYTEYSRREKGMARWVKGMRQKRYGKLPEDDIGNVEQPNARIGWLAPVAQVIKPQAIECPVRCPDTSHCWQGECIERPWQYSNTPGMSCYADPHVPGLSETWKSTCRSATATYTERDCLGAASFCRWTNDAPAWFRDIENEKWRMAQEAWQREKDAMHEGEGDNQAKYLLNFVRPGNPVLGDVMATRDGRRYEATERYEVVTPEYADDKTVIQESITDPIRAKRYQQGSDFGSREMTSRLSSTR